MVVAWGLAIMVSRSTSREDVCVKREIARTSNLSLGFLGGVVLSEGRLCEKREVEYKRLSISARKLSIAKKIGTLIPRLWGWHGGSDSVLAASSLLGENE